MGNFADNALLCPDYVLGQNANRRTPNVEKAIVMAFVALMATAAKSCAGGGSCPRKIVRATHARLNCATPCTLPAPPSRDSRMKGAATAGGPRISWSSVLGNARSRAPSRAKRRSRSQRAPERRRARTCLCARSKKITAIEPKHRLLDTPPYPESGRRIGVAAERYFGRGHRDE